MSKVTGSLYITCLDAIFLCKENIFKFNLTFSC